MKLRQIIRSQLDEYQARDTSDYEVIKAHLEEHAQDLVRRVTPYFPLTQILESANIFL